MQIIKPSCSLVEIANPFKLCERVGRVCYKSEDKITEDSYKTFIINILNRGHYSVLEHANFLFAWHGNMPVRFLMALDKPGIYIHRLNQYSFRISMNLRNAIELAEKSLIFDFIRMIRDTYDFPIEFNLEKLASSTDLPVGSRIDLIQKPDFDEDFTFETVEFQIARGIWDELARHRENSCACESSRYCMYSKDKFNGEIKFNEPVWYKEADWLTKWQWRSCLKSAEKNYMKFLAKGYKPQFARGLLPLDYSVNCIVTANLTQWKHIFELRTSQAAHPDMQFIMKQVRELMKRKHPSWDC